MNKNTKTLDTILQEFKKVHGEKYNYDKFQYMGAFEKSIIICPEHGEFLQSASHHKKGHGCRKCARILTLDKVIGDFKKVHGEKYDYSKVAYKTAADKVIIICPEHGEFLQAPRTHKSGVGCKQCGINENARKKISNSSSNIIDDFKKTHGEKYDYSKVVYTKMHQKVEIICPKHGIFKQSAISHKNGSGCPKCGYNLFAHHNRDYFKNKRTILYYIHLLDFNMFKVGITTRSIPKRFGKKLEYEILYEEVFEDGANAWDKEQKILNSTIKYEYLGEDIISSGNTELRTKDIIKYIKDLK